MTQISLEKCNRNQNALTEMEMDADAADYYDDHR